MTCHENYSFINYFYFYQMTELSQFILYSTNCNHSCRIQPTTQQQTMHTNIQVIINQFLSDSITWSSPTLCCCGRTKFITVTSGPALPPPFTCSDSSQISSPAGLSSVSGRKQLATRLTRANIENTIITLKPELRQLSMMYCETARVIAPEKVMRLKPITLICVGQSQVKQTQKQVYSADTQKVMMNRATKIPMLSLIETTSPSPGRQTKISATEHTMMIAIDPIATTFLLHFLTTRQQNTSEITYDTPSTTPLMNMLSWKSLSMRLGEKKMKDIDIWTMIRKIVSRRSEGYRNRSSTVNLEADYSYFYLVSCTLLAYSISYMVKSGDSTLFTLAIHSNLLRTYSAGRLLTSMMGVSTVKKMIRVRMIARGMRKKQMKICSQSLIQKQRPVSTRSPRLKKICRAIREYSLQAQSIIYDTMVMLMQKTHWNPIMLIINPTEAAQMCVPKRTKNSPPIATANPATVKVLRPKQSPVIAISALPPITPRYVIKIDRVMVPDSGVHLKSPNLLVRVAMVLVGMYCTRSDRARLQTQALQVVSLGRVLVHQQASSQNRQGAIKMICPLSKTARQSSTKNSFWYIPKVPTFWIMLKNSFYWSGGAEGVDSASWLMLMSMGFEVYMDFKQNSFTGCTNFKKLKAIYAQDRKIDVIWKLRLYCESSMKVSRHVSMK